MNHSFIKYAVLFLLFTEINCQYTESQKWAYGMLLSLAISLVGFFVSIVIVCFRIQGNSAMFQSVINTLVAFAVGSLVGDAMIHLIPHAFEVHETTDNEDQTQEQDHSHQEDDVFPFLLIKFFQPTTKEFLLSLCLVMGIFAFYIIEKMVTILNHSAEPKSERQNIHKIIPQNSEEAQTDIQQKQEQPEVDIATLSIYQQLFKCSSWKNKPTITYLNLISDLIHNIIDGLALGVLFASGEVELAISTFVAILIHELAQEIGDTSILLQNKFTNAQTIFSNGIVNLTALFGTIIGLSIGEINNDQYVAALIAGNFLYIACVDMLPEIVKETNLKHSAIQTTAILVGLAIMFGIAILEHQNE